MIQVVKADAPPPAWKLFWPYAALAVLGLTWSAFWYMASTATQRALDGWFAQERSLGRDWTCGERSLGGYPFRIELRCASAKFEGRLGGAQGKASVGDLLAASHLYRPSLVVAQITGPLAFRADQSGLDFTMEWGKLLISHRMNNGALEQTSVEMEAPVLRLRDQANVKADRLEIHLRMTPGQPADLSAYDLAVRLEKLATPALDKLTGESDPMDLVLSLTALRTRAFAGASVPQSLESWRLAQGNVEIRELKLAKGNARLEATGQLGLDDARRLRGKVDLQLTGLGTLMQRSGLPLAVNSQNMRVLLTLENGRVSMGLLRFNWSLPPLY
jgi:hypothetical protein